MNAIKLPLIIAAMKKRVIGRIDKADFPELGITDIAIKIDTGAYTSSIHCEKIIEQNNVLQCLFLDPEHSLYNKKMFTFHHYKRTIVKSSNGIAASRYVIQTTLKLFDTQYKISLSLSDRKDMKFPVLIGRKFLNGKFIVDPKCKNLSFIEVKNTHEH